jgi:hypothetical protein
VNAAALRLAPVLEMGSLRVAAELQDPVVYAEPDAPEVLRVTEGAVDLALHFPDSSAVHRFVRRVAALGLPPAHRP